MKNTPNRSALCTLSLNDLHKITKNFIFLQVYIQIYFGIKKDAKIFLRGSQRGLLESVT